MYKKAKEMVDEKTKGKYADKLASARAKVSESVAKVADLPPAPAPPPDAEHPDYRRRRPEELPPAEPPAS